MTNSIKVKLRNKSGGATAVHRIATDETYERWWQRYGSADLRMIYENFGMELFRRSSCLDGFSSFIDRTGFKGQRCVEIGSCNGLTALVLARQFEEVVSFDIEPRPIKRDLAAYCGLTNIKFIDVKDNDVKAEMIDGLEFDAAYCDGDHTHDSQFDLALVKRCGRVMFHEYWPLCPQVWGLVNDLRAEGNVQTHGTYAIWTATR